MRLVSACMSLVYIQTFKQKLTLIHIVMILYQLQLSFQQTAVVCPFMHHNVVQSNAANLEAKVEEANILLEKTKVGACTHI